MAFVWTYQFIVHGTFVLEICVLFVYENARKYVEFVEICAKRMWLIQKYVKMCESAYFRIREFGSAINLKIFDVRICAKYVILLLHDQHKPVWLRVKANVVVV